VVVNPRGLEPTGRGEGPRSQPAQDRESTFSSTNHWV